MRAVTKLTENTNLTTPVMGMAFHWTCLLYTSDAADEARSVDLGGVLHT